LWSKYGKAAHLFLASGILCYSIVAALYFSKNKIQSYPAVTTISLSLEMLAQSIWGIPSLLIAILLILGTVLLYCRVRLKAQLLPALMRWGLPFLVFLYTIIPLRWAQRDLNRSLESFPSYTTFDSLLMLLGVTGTILCCLYCFEKLPHTIVGFVEKAAFNFYHFTERYFVGSLLILCLVTTGVISYLVLDHIPHVVDSIAQLFQAKIFTMGKITVPIPPHKEFFDYMFIINDRTWYSQYLPGHCLLLMLGLFVRAPWLIGPLLGTISLCIFYLLMKNLYRDTRLAYLGSTLFLFSPFFLFMSSSHMNHTSTLLCILLFLYSYQRTFSSNTSTWALIAGVSLGYAALIRPLTAAAIGIPFIYNLLMCAAIKKELKIKKVFIFFGAIALTAAVILLYNYLTNGNPFLFGYQQKHATLGFLGNAQEGPPHTLGGGVINTSNNLIGLNTFLFEWPLPSLIFIFILFIIPWKKNRWDYLFLSSSITLMIGYFFYYFQDYCFGPRFYYSLLPFMIILTTRGFFTLPQFLEHKQWNKRKVEVTLYVLLTLCFLYSFSVSLPRLVRKYSNDYWGVTSRIHTAVKEQGITDAIVFLDCWDAPDSTQPNLLYYGSGFQFNSPDLKDEVMYALDLKDKNGELMDAFPAKRYYRCTFLAEEKSTIGEIRLIELSR
jgi:hypothetical protein